MITDTRQTARLRAAPMLPNLPEEPSLFEIFKRGGNLTSILEQYDVRKKEQATRLAQYMARVQETLLDLAKQKETGGDFRKAWYSATWLKNSSGGYTTDVDGSGTGLSVEVVANVFEDTSADATLGWISAGQTSLGTSPSALPGWFGQVTPHTQTSRRQGFPAVVRVRVSAPGSLRISALPHSTFGFNPDRDVQYASRQCIANVAGEYLVFLRAEEPADGEDVSAVKIPLRSVYVELLT